MEEEVQVDFRSLFTANVIVKDLMEEVEDLSFFLLNDVEDITEEEFNSKMAVLNTSMNALIINLKNVKESVLSV